MRRAEYIEDISLEGRLAEINEKLIKVRNMLEQNGKEALLLTKHPNFSWITAGGKNFVANCFDAGAVSILITKNGQYAICNVIEEPRIIEEEKLPELGFTLHVYKWQENRLEEYVKKHVGSMENVISDMPCGSAQVSPELIAPLRLQFTTNEIARYCHLGDVMSQALEEYLVTVEPGMTEYEIAGGISNALWKHNIEQVMHLVSVDERALHYRHALPTEKKLRHNLLVSINGRYKGLITTVSRMVYFGKPDPAFVAQYRDCCEMESLTMSKAKVGADEIDMYNTMYKAYIDKGYPTMFDKHGQGGCQGYWPREYMITPTNHNIIKENQAYCFNPVVDGTKTEDSFIVTKEGLISITRPISFPKLTYSFDGIEIERPDLMIID
jgi:Xaa-Pro dipeptidase